MAFELAKLYVTIAPDAKAYFTVMAEVQKEAKKTTKILDGLSNTAKNMFMSFGKSLILKAIALPFKIIVSLVKTTISIITKLASAVLKFAINIPVHIVKSAFSAINSIIEVTVNSLKNLGRVARWTFLGLSVSFGLLTKRFIEFETQMAFVQARTDATGKQFEQLETLARELGKTTIFTAAEAASAMAKFAQAGFTVNEVLKAARPILNLAAAGQLSMLDSANTLVGVLRGMGLGIKDLNSAVDMLAFAANNANTNILQLGTAMQKIGPLALSVGARFSEVVAFIRIFSDVAIQGEQAGTALRNLFLRMQTGQEGVGKALKKLGVDTYDATGSFKALSVIIDELNAAESRVDKRSFTMAINLIGGARAAAALKTAMKVGGVEIRRMAQEMEDATGTAAKFADIMVDTLRGSLLLVEAAFTELNIILLKAVRPAFREVLDLLRRVANYFSQFNIEMIKSLTSIAAVAVGVVALTAAVSFLIPVLFTLLNPVSLLVSGFLLLAGNILLAQYGTVSFGKRVEETERKIRVLIDTIVNISDAVDVTREGFNKLIDDLEELQAKTLKLTLADRIRDIGNAISDYVKKNTKQLDSWLGHILDTFAAAQVVVENWRLALELSLDKVRLSFLKLKETIAHIIGNVIPSIFLILMKTFEEMRPLLENKLDTFISIVKEKLNDLKFATIAGVKAVLEAAWNEMVSFGVKSKGERKEEAIRKETIRVQESFEQITGSDKSAMEIADKWNKLNIGEQDKFWLAAKNKAEKRFSIDLDSDKFREPKGQTARVKALFGELIRAMKMREFALQEGREVRTTEWAKLWEDAKEGVKAIAKLKPLTPTGIVGEQVRPTGERRVLEIKIEGMERELETEAKIKKREFKDLFGDFFKSMREKSLTPPVLNRKEIEEARGFTSKQLSKANDLARARFTVLEEIRDTLRGSKRRGKGTTIGIFEEINPRFSLSSD